MLSLNRSSVYFVDGLSNASRGSSINYNIIDIAVDHILNGKRTALVAYTNSFKSGELHLRVALAVKLTCGAVLNADFYAAVDTAARAELAKHPQLVNLDATVLQQNALYRREYDLGDKCDVRDDRLQLAYEARIIEVNEVWKNNTHQVSLQFGQKLPVAYRRIG